METVTPTSAERISRYQLTRSGPASTSVSCIICRSERQSIGLVCAQCYELARDEAADVETDGLYASLEGIADVLHKYETRGLPEGCPWQLPLAPGCYVVFETPAMRADPTPWVGHQSRASRKDTPRIPEMSAIGGAR